MLSVLYLQPYTLHGCPSLQGRGSGLVAKFSLICKAKIHNTKNVNFMILTELSRVRKPIGCQQFYESMSIPVDRSNTKY